LDYGSVFKVRVSASLVGKRSQISPLENIGSDDWSFTTQDAPAKGAVYLVSGSLEYVMDWTAKLPNPLLVLWDEHI
jgi:hypothetical protein